MRWDLWNKPLHAVMLLIMLGVGIAAKSFLTQFGKSGADIAVGMLQSSSVLVRSQSSALTYRVAVVNRSSFPDPKVQSVMEVLQKQVKRDLAPVWVLVQASASCLADQPHRKTNGFFK
jgi:hypothetical protein